MLLDILDTILSAGLATHQIGQLKAECQISQVFIALDPLKLSNFTSIDASIHQIIQDYKSSTPADENTEVVYPGERVARIRKTNLEKGIPVEDKIWEKIQKLLKEEE